ncbi:phosphopyruvate hydratase [Haloplanus rubicundus]|uniref:Enolase n=1 Tax=Haloplanus rubicundus TaxID=1547898 RepID=A0A345E996_9EURY|nr:phosphopyruvate hydratase [Haloplanus rubicundus]AXG08768.1 phosphopyruvate hydratase [Haloplanus rubicundus]
MTASPIESVAAREILDNRLEPTLRVTVETPVGTGRADVPRGRSRGAHEAHDRRDGDDRYRGQGVKEAVAAVEEDVEPALVGHDATDQRGVDAALLDLDGTRKKERLGGNVVTGVSLAALRAGAAATGLPLYRYVGGADAGVLPLPFFDLIEGGELAGGDLPFQEHQVVPVGADSVAEAVRWTAEVYYELGDILRDEYGEASLNVGDEGGYNPLGVDDPREAFDLELRAVEACGYGGEFALAADVAASHFHDAETGTYALLGESMTRDELLGFYEDLVADYPIVSLEDPLDQHDFAGVADLTDRLDVQIVGDDLFTTNPERLQEGIDHGAANALLWKVNQIGTVTEATEAARLATRNGYAVQVSERSGQTPDTWLADLAVGLGAGQIKTGVTRGERTEQYNRLLEIEAELGDAATFGPPGDALR